MYFVWEEGIRAIFSYAQGLLQHLVWVSICGAKDQVINLRWAVSKTVSLDLGLHSERLINLRKLKAAKSHTNVSMMNLLTV